MRVTIFSTGGNSAVFRFLRSYTLLLLVAHSYALLTVRMAPNFLPQVDQSKDTFEMVWSETELYQESNSRYLAWTTKPLHVHALIKNSHYKHQ